ncbi:MAG: flagellin [bacterium]
MRISTSVHVLVNRNALRSADNDVRTRIERLSSGLRIARGADDPSGLAISKRMTGQIRGYDVAVGNCQDGINLLQTMDGGLAEIHDLLMRMREIAVRAANEAVLTAADGTRLNGEILKLKEEITRTATAATFNGNHILIGDAEPGEYRIVFMTNRDGNTEIYSMKSDGSNPVNLTNNGTSDAFPSWSSDGSSIAFQTFRDGNWEIYAMNRDGSNPVRLTNNGALDLQPSWSPDGSKVAFFTDRDGNYEIYVMNSDGSNPVNLTNNGAVDYWHAWSPGGSKIAFTTNRDGNYEIYAMDSDGSNPVRLTSNPASDVTPAWSPDGSKIAFTTNRDGNYEIYVMDSDGSNPVRLTSNPASDVNPAWSPEGSKIAFTTNRDGNYEIYVMNSDGSNPVNITANGATDSIQYAAWGSASDDVKELQVGPDAGENYRIEIRFPDARAAGLGVSYVGVTTADGAKSAITMIDRAIDKVSDLRSEIGRSQGRIGHIVNDNTAAYVNLSAAKSRIEDADMAAELTGLTKARVARETALSIGAQANFEAASVLNLMEQQWRRDAAKTPQK